MTEAVVLAAVGWFVSPLIKTMVDNAISFTRRNINWKQDREQKLQELISSLMRVQTVVASVERRQLKDASQAALLRQLKDVIYDIDDWLDEFDYQLLHSEAENGGRLRHPVAPNLNLTKRIFIEDELHINLIRILEKLEDVKKSADTLLQVLGPEIDPSAITEPHRLSSSLQAGFYDGGSPAQISDKHKQEDIEKQIVGRSKELKYIETWITAGGEAQSSSRDISVLSITGAEGIGKTSLAQHVYNMTKDFNFKIWIHVFNKFDLKRLTNEILEALDDEHRYMHNFNQLQIKLQKCLETKKFLLVLDDVWQDETMTTWKNSETWSKLLAPLKSGAPGSRILVTTRMNIVAKNFHETRIVELQRLNQEETWELLRYFTGLGNPKSNTKLENSGKTIAKKLNGLPLTTKVVAARLKENLDVHYWEKFSERTIFEDTVKVLRLSFERLPNHLKVCFAYCSIFPKGWRFDPKDLVQLWMAQGFVQPPWTGQGFMQAEDAEIENLGKNYLDELLGRSFFKMLTVDTLTFYIIDDLMHSVAENVAIGECFRIERYDHKMRIPAVRHLGIDTSNREETCNILSMLEQSLLKNLRSLIIFGRDTWSTLHFSEVQDQLKKLKNVRALAFHHVDIEGLPQSLNHLHLRYLRLQTNSSSVMRKSIRHVYHLQALIALGGCNVSIRSLRHLNKLRFGQGVFELCVKRRKGYRVKELKRWNLHGKLRLRYLENLVRDQARSAELVHNESIGTLALEWTPSTWTRRNTDAVLEELQPHPNVRHLHVYGFQGITFPGWLSQLETITLANLRSWEVLPQLGHLPSLRTLELEEMHAKRIGVDFYRGSDRNVSFPSLEELAFKNMPKWIEWSEIGECLQLFPRLWQLRIEVCPKLMVNLAMLSSIKILIIEDSPKILPSNSTTSRNEGNTNDDRCILHPNLESLEISRFRLTNLGLSRCLQGLTSLSSLEIRYCTHLKSLPSQESLQHLTALHDLKIHSCNELTSLAGLQALNSLRHLSIVHCKYVKSIPEVPTSLRSLKIYECDPQLMEQLKNKEGPEWEKITCTAHVSYEIRP